MIINLTCYWQIAPHRNDISFDEWMALDILSMWPQSRWISSGLGTTERANDHVKAKGKQDTVIIAGQEEFDKF